MPHQVPPLPYDYAALEPHIDSQTMHLHHDKHHAAYVTNLNAALDKTSGLAQQVDHRGHKKYQFGAGRHSHRGAQSWRRPRQPHHVLGDHEAQRRRRSPGQIADAIKGELGGFDNLKQKFNEAGAKLFGSGWVWVVSKGNKLEIITTPNQDSPYMQGYYPIFGNDVWEHAYYLKYQNRRPDYLQAWWNTVNWDAINKRLEEASRMGRAA